MYGTSNINVHFLIDKHTLLASAPTFKKKIKLKLIQQNWNQPLNRYKMQPEVTGLQHHIQFVGCLHLLYIMVPGPGNVLAYA